MIKDIDSDKKADILISALDERYQSIHKIRGRVESAGVWFLGIMLSVSGWLMQSDMVLSCPQKLVYILAVTVAFIAVRFVYLEDLCKGFKGQQRIAVKLEKALGFFTPGFFNDSGESVYPEKWEKVGTADGDGKFFHSTYTLIYIGTIFLILTILFSGCFVHVNHFIPQHYFRF